MLKINNMAHKIMLILLLLVYPTTAYAYIDPGIGSLMLQGIIAGIAVVTTTIGVYWKKIKSFFSKFKSKKQTFIWPPLLADSRDGWRVFGGGQGRRSKRYCGR